MNQARLAQLMLGAFLVVIVVQDLVRGDVSATRHWISHLSLGPVGWINIANLVLGGVAVLAVARLLRVSGGTTWSVLWVLLAGVGLVLAGLLVTDAPPGTRYAEEVTWHGQLHEIAGGLTFLGLFASCLATRRRLSSMAGIVCAVLVITAFGAASVLAAVNYSVPGAELPAGLAERLAMLTGIGWLFVLSRRLDGRRDRLGGGRVAKRRSGAVDLDGGRHRDPSPCAGAHRGHRRRGVGPIVPARRRAGFPRC